MDGAGPIEFSVSTPASDDELRENIAHALSLGLREADSAIKHLNILANGPSARNVRLGTLKGDSMALNNSLKLFTDEGGSPTYWIGCDPQKELAQFVTGGLSWNNPPEKTIYLVASKCHPRVFEALRQRDVRLWHVNDIAIPGKRQVPCAVSVTICAMLLAGRLGYRTIDVYGWDCCYDGDRDHAAPTRLPATAQRIQIEVGEPPNASYFVSNPTWACEVNDAKGVLPVLRWCGTDVKIHGRSMVTAILPEFAA